MGSYRELAHPHNTGVQSRLLVSRLGREVMPTIPLYAFYNPARTCAASGGAVAGIELASAREIRELVKLIVRVKPKRLPFKRIGALQSLFFPLTTILCPPAVPSGPLRAIPSPAQARDAVEQSIERRGSAVGISRAVQIEGTGSPLLDDETEPPGTKAQSRLPAAVRAVIERRGERIVRARVARPLVVLISEG